MDSLRIAVENRKSPVDKTGVILFKREGITHQRMSSNVFAIAFMSEQQVSLWNEYAQKAVGIDSTFCVSKHKFRLVTVLVIGLKEVGIPVACLITNKEEKNILSCLSFKLSNQEIDLKRTIF